jgi:hypothetical protein
LIFVTVLFLSCRNNGGNDELVRIFVNLNHASFYTDSAVKVPEDFTGICHTGNSENLDREYGVLNELAVNWIHRDFSWSAIQPGCNCPSKSPNNPDGCDCNFGTAICSHPDCGSKKYAPPSEWNWASFDDYVKRANTEGKKILAMLLYDVAWVHDHFDLPHGRRIRNAPENQLEFFVRYAEETVKRYSDKSGLYVDAWLIWNEPDLNPRFWTGTQKEFFELTKQTAEAIRPLTDAYLLGGVFSPIALSDPNWVTGLFASGAMNEVDGVAFHPYSPLPLGSLRFFEEFRALVPENFKDKIWLNEMGYPTFLERGQIPPGRMGTDQYEGDMPEVVTKTYALLASAGARNLTWYHLLDSGRPVSTRNPSNSENWFGLMWRPSEGVWAQKGGYWGFALCANNIPGKTYREIDFSGQNISEDLYTYYFEGDDGSRVLVAWNNSTFLPMELTISLPGSNHKLWNVENGNPTNVNATSTHILQPMFTYQKTLVFLTWDE